MLGQVEIKSGGHGYCSMADKGGAAATFEDAVLSETLQLVAEVQNWDFSEYWTRCVDYWMRVGLRGCFHMAVVRR